MKKAKIYKPTKTAMQSGTKKFDKWIIEFITEDTGINPLMGWESSTDTLTELNLEFTTKELAIDYAKKNDIDFEISQAGVEASMLKRIYDLKDSVNDILLVSYGDTLTNIDVDDLKKKHIKYGKLITIVITEIKNPFGLV